MPRQTVFPLSYGHLAHFSYALQPLSERLPQERSPDCIHAYRRADVCDCRIATQMHDLQCARLLWSRGALRIAPAGERDK